MCSNLAAINLHFHTHIIRNQLTLSRDQQRIYKDWQLAKYNKFHINLYTILWLRVTKGPYWLIKLPKIWRGHWDCISWGLWNIGISSRLPSLQPLLSKISRRGWRKFGQKSFPIFPIDWNLISPLAGGALFRNGCRWGGGGGYIWVMTFQSMGKMENLLRKPPPFCFFVLET